MDSSTLSYQTKTRYQGRGRCHLVAWLQPDYVQSCPGHHSISTSVCATLCAVLRQKGLTGVLSLVTNHWMSTRASGVQLKRLADTPGGYISRRVSHNFVQSEQWKWNEGETSFIKSCVHPGYWAHKCWLSEWLISLHFPVYQNNLSHLSIGKPSWLVYQVLVGLHKAGTCVCLYVGGLIVFSLVWFTVGAIDSACFVLMFSQRMSC